ncbi:MAG: NADH:flavin oxidoreductase [Chloroflexi bacterium]|uniref:oxidoreductase n=1 Tax=Candidatus Flexifilum breve TaxID=3140694 RepID=UPI003134C970|nr:NADH:flavin oxidoreductase [Chloroflexota bacterium]
MAYKRVAQLRTADDFREYNAALGIDLPFDEAVDVSALAQPISVYGWEIGNRFCILPMEGWDAAPDGHVTDLVKRRWQHFGQSGAKLIWGGEAVAVRHDGRANPNQLVIREETLDDLRELRALLVSEHAARYTRTDDLLIGLQLTHSGRFSRPNEKKKPEPRIAYHHPILDRRLGIQGDDNLFTDEALYELIQDFIKAAVLAQAAGFDFVDVKHCHGYLGHELLTAVDRPGDFGGSFENRTRFLRLITAGIRQHAPGLHIGVRLSAFDLLPYKPGEDRIGVPEAVNGGYPYAFGGDGSGAGIDLTETKAFLRLLEALDIRLVCLTAGSPYYNPHIQRPALFPPSDGYQPPEDPLVGVARQINAAAQLKRDFPHLVLVGTGYSYLQDWLPNVASYAVRTGMVDSVGLGRMVLSYPELPADVLAGVPLQRKRICRTFSDCTTAPRNGMVSGCYPLDPFYKARDEYHQLSELKHDA